MKLALVRQKYTPFGGAERFVERALGALRQQGTDVTIIARSWQGESGHGLLQCNPFFLGRTWRDAGFARAVQRIIASAHFDLVQSHERIPGCHIYRAGDGVHATWLDLRARIRGVAPRLTFSPWHRYTLSAEAAMFGNPNLRAVICNSRMVRDDIAARFGTPTDKLHVIYNGIDREHFHPRLRQEHRQAVRARLGVADSTPILLYVGSGFERKGVSTLLEALPLIERRNAVLLIVGRDRKAHDLQMRANRLHIADRVHFLGGQADVRPFYGAADCFVLPSLYDPMPNAALEALACGLQVVTTTTCGAAELLQPGISGFVIPPLDVSALARAIDESLNQPGEADAIAATTAHLSLDAMTERLMGLYGTVV